MSASRAAATPAASVPRKARRSMRGGMLAQVPFDFEPVGHAGNRAAPRAARGGSGVCELQRPLGRPPLQQSIDESAAKHIPRASRVDRRH